MLTYDIHRLVNQLIIFKESPQGEVLAWIAPLAAIIFVAIIKLILRWREKKIDKINARKLILSAGTTAFTEDDFYRARQHYVEQDSGNLDPTDGRDFLSALSVTAPMYRTLDTELSKGNYRHVIIFADSGMGKTTLLLNYFARECKRRNGRRIAIIPLNRPTALDDIKKISNQNETTLFLDAFDEDAHAIHNHLDRLRKLMIAAADFQKVVITCRTQFFQNDHDIPVSTGIWRAGSRSASESATHEFRRVYLMPFDTKKCESYIKLRIPIWRHEQRKIALRHIESLHDLPMRPMLLEQIPDLAKAKAKIRSLFELYEFMVETWYQREKDWITSNTLKATSIAIAVHIMTHRNENETNTLTAQDVDRILVKSGISLDTSERWALRTRSLLNRNSIGQIKFAHQTILEYYFVLSLIEGNKQPLETTWTDHSLSLLKDWFSHANSVELARVTKMIRNNDLRQSGLVPILPPAPQITGTIDRQDFSTLNAIPKTPTDISTPLRFINAFTQTINANVEINGEYFCKLTRIYDLAFGAIYTIPYDLNRSHKDCAHAWNITWESMLHNGIYRNELPPMNYLGRILYCANLHLGPANAFNRYDLYWLGNGSGGLRYVFRSHKISHPPIKLGTRFEFDFETRLEYLNTHNIEVYRALDPKEFAICISVSFATAERIWAEETSDLGWAEDHIRRYSRLDSKQMHSFSVKRITNS